VFPWALLEYSRLYSGYYGNLKETVHFRNSNDYGIVCRLIFVHFVDTDLHRFSCCIYCFTKKISIGECFMHLVFHACIWGNNNRVLENENLSKTYRCYALSKLVRSQTALFFLRTPHQSYKPRQRKEVNILVRNKNNQENKQDLSKEENIEVEMKKMDRQPSDNHDLRKRRLQGSQYQPLRQEDSQQ